MEKLPLQPADLHRNRSAFTPRYDQRIEFVLRTFDESLAVVTTVRRKLIGRLSYLFYRIFLD